MNTNTCNVKRYIYFVNNYLSSCNDRHTCTPACVLAQLNSSRYWIVPNQRKSQKRRQWGNDSFQLHQSKSGVFKFHTIATTFSFRAARRYTLNSFSNQETQYSNIYTSGVFSLKAQAAFPQLWKAANYQPCLPHCQSSLFAWKFPFYLLAVVMKKVHVVFSPIL